LISEYMAGSVVTERKSLEPTRTAVGGRFGKFGPEVEKASRKAETKENEAIRRMKAAWRACEWDEIKGIDGYHEAILQIVKNLRYTAKDVENFSLVLAEFQDGEYFSWKAGIFLSTLINKGKDCDYVIRTQHLATPPDNLGICNEKNIIVDGDVGHNLGYRMESGCITVEGDAESDVGSSMEDGNITIKGNAGLHVGQNMLRGRIIIKGNVGHCVGWQMKGGNITIEGNAGHSIGVEISGGEIYIHGDYMTIPDIFGGGRVYHKGELIRPIRWIRLRQ
jgi:hypothetical protein